MTSKGQATFPKAYSGQAVHWTWRQDRVHGGGRRQGAHTPVTATVTRLKGMVSKPKTRLSLETLDEVVAKAAVQRRLR